jgi:hypothetical protein
MQSVRFEALTAVATKSSTFWDITKRSRFKANNVSEECVASIFRAKKINQARNHGVASRADVCKKNNNTDITLQTVKLYSLVIV